MLQNKVVILLIGFIFLSFNAKSQTKLSKQQAIEDIQYLKKKIENYHAGAFYYAKKSAFFQRVDSVVGSIDDS
jgi:hypothetical protein